MGSTKESLASTLTSSPGGEQNVMSRSGKNVRGTMLCLALVNLVCAIDTTILTVCLTTIAEDLHGSALEAFWMGTSFLLASTITQPLWNPFSELYGQKSVIIPALALFTLGSSLGAISNNFAILLASRALQGFGGGGLTVLTYIIIADLIPLCERGKYFGMISSVWAFGTVLGPVIGGFISQRGDWHWIFWMNIPVCLFAFILIPHFVQDGPKVARSDGFFGRLGLFDWFGAGLLFTSLAGMIIPLSWGGVMYDWKSPATIVPVMVSCALLSCFVVYNARFSKRPLIRREIFSSTACAAVYVTTTFHGMVTFSILYYIPLFYEATMDYSPENSGKYLLPYTLAVGPMAGITGYFISKRGTYRFLAIAGWSLIAVGTGLLGLFREQIPLWEWVSIEIIGGVGLGIVFSTQNFAVQALSSDQDRIQAAAMSPFFRSLGQTVGLVIGGTIFQNTFKSLVYHNSAYSEFSDSWSRNSATLLQRIKSVSVIDLPDLEAFIVSTFVSSLRVIWITLCAISAMSLIITLVLVKDRNFREHTYKNNISNHQEVESQEDSCSITSEQVSQLEKV